MSRLGSRRLFLNSDTSSSALDSSAEIGKHSRSSAGHLAEQTRALRAGLGRRSAGLLAVLLLGSGHGGVGAALLLRRGSRDGRADGGTRRGAAGRSVARHGDERGG